MAIAWKATTKEIGHVASRLVDHVRVGKSHEAFSENIALDGHAYCIRYVPYGQAFLGGAIHKLFRRDSRLTDGYIRVDRTDLPSSPGRRLASAICDVFGHRLRDLFDKEKAEVVGMRNMFGRADTIALLVDRRCDEQLLFKSPKCWVPDISDYQ